MQTQVDSISRDIVNSGYDSSNEISEVAVEDEKLIGHRNLDKIKEEILNYKDQVEVSFIKMGELLISAKEKIKDGGGNWLPWLRDNVEISHVMACRLMKIAKEFSNNVSPVTHLGVTKVSILVSLPSDEREKFIVEQHDIDGTIKSVDDMSKRELQESVNKRKLEIRPNRIKPPEENFSFQVIRRNSSANIAADQATGFLKDLKKLQKDVDKIIATHLCDTTNKNNAITALRIFCETTLEKIQTDKFNVL